MANQHSQSSGSSASTLIDATIEAFDQGQAASPQEGLSLITDWFSSLKSDHAASKMIQPLQELQTELQSGSPSNQKLHDLLLNLADQTETLGETAAGDLPSRLATLSTSLRNFAGQLSTTV
ncbi:hypothetical protein [Fibrivirga algicola]|uniref:Uncharacterized protein n=1 Tax=Fibrivirga algicola TaxID=2950420 RepID=A0ABX0QM22_9BACT|nr:hypothetical protein [Fibrivirga algicola]ARK10341.1 hypothetical protein A6C57_08370 [Fibrella sp. ES10-3-2-2]NID11848.1 hypothetical protein [Fibrivirga algicola]